MKKTLLTCGALLLMGWGANAQLAMENFNAAGLPANWVMIKVDSHVPNAGLNAIIVDSLTNSAWMKWPVSATDSCMLTTSYFVNATDQADRWLITPSFTVTSANMVLKFQDYAVDPSYPDKTQVWVSPTAGTTVPDFTTKLYDAAGGTDGFVQRGVYLGAYNGQTIRLAFRDNSTNQYVLMLDNVGTTVMTNSTDGANNNISVKTIQPLSGSAPVSLTFSNTGAQNITTLKAQYVVDAGSPVMQTFSSLNVAPYGSATVNFTTPITGLSAGSHSVTVTILQENGNNDPTAADNAKTKAFAVVDPANSVTRNGLIEEFSSSTCNPCASFNATFDPLLQTNNANTPAAKFNIIKYQMNWPGSGNDASYNNPGLARRTYYGCNAIPEHWTNGVPGGAGDQAEITASKADPAYMTITGTYNIHGNNINASATCTPKFTITGADFSVHMVVAERHYQNAANTNGQLQYYYVERNMLGAGNGTAAANWTANTAQTFNFTAPYVVGNVQQLNTNFWGDPMQSDMVMFVQDNSDQTILQSVVVPASWPTGVKELNGIADMAIFPNPATSQATLGFNTTEAANIDISLVDALGRTVYSYSQRFEAGSQRIVIPTGNLAAGIYNVRVQTASGVATTRLTVAK
jgi:hypothetical protein